jgi:hypothetical protein
VRLPDPGALASAAAAIGRRRRRHDDGLPVDDPLGIVEYVLQHRGVPRHVLAEDAGDVLELIGALEARLARDKLAAIRLARSAGLKWHQIARRQGFRSPQAAYQLFQRLSEEQASGRRSEVAARQRAGCALSEAEWAERNEKRIRDCARALATVPSCAPDDPDLADWLEDITSADRNPDSTTRQIAGLLRLAARAHGAAPPHEHGHACQVLAEAAGLAEQWDKLAGSGD